MNYSSHFCIFTSLSTLIITFTLLNINTNAIEVTYDGRAVKIDGERKIIISGSIHYPRSTPEMWPDLIRKSKEGGINAIETYVFWNVHEPLYRKYDFTGNLDLLKFLKLIQDAGLYAILRIGPYVCAEWNFGGIPVWIKSKPDMTIRTHNYAWINEMKNFTNVIVDMVKQAKLFAPEGGPIILAQIENEYGNIISSYGEAGKAYINWCATFAESLNIGVPWIMCQQPDAPPSMINTCNGFYCDQFWPTSPNIPKMWTENWTGWFKKWGGRHPHRSAEDLAFSVARFYQFGGTLQNYYMYHGGTNFGRTSGGPYITTSYDYDAPLDEYGNLNQPKWGHLKNLHNVLMSVEKILTDGEISNYDHGRMMSSTVFSYNGTRVCFFGNGNNQDNITFDFEGKNYTIPSWSVSILPDCASEVYNTAKVTTQTITMVKKLPAEAKPKLHYEFEWKWRAEYLKYIVSHGNSSNPLKGFTYANELKDQKLVTNDKSDYLWYMTDVYIDEMNPLWGKEVVLYANTSCHVLHAYFNGRHIGSQWAKYGTYNFVFERNVKLKLGINKIALLSVTVGLQNYGAFIDKTSNGILGPVKLIASNSGEMDLSANEWIYKAGLNGMKRGFGSVNNYIKDAKRKWRGNIPINKMFVWYKTTFRTPQGNESVVLDLDGLGKGTTWVNGHDIGRYWTRFMSDENGCNSYCDYKGAYTDSKCMTNCGKSSQRWYHVPRSFLNEVDNTLILFEEIGGNPHLTSIQIVTSGQ